jgi:hypothetical protein
VTGLTFDAPSHTYHYDKRHAPGVTTVLRPYNDLEHVDPDLLRAAAEFGNHVHEAVDLFNRDALDYASVTDPVAAYLVGWEMFLDESGFVVTASEERVYHPRLGYAGCLDVIGNFPKHASPALVDVKTSVAVPRTVGPQTAAYVEAYAASKSRRRLRRYCVHIGPSKYNLVPLTDPRDFDIFKAALTLHKWQTGH